MTYATSTFDAYRVGRGHKVVQARLRHASASTRLNVYGHLMPDADESARNAINAVLAAAASRL